MSIIPYALTIVLFLHVSINENDYLEDYMFSIWINQKAWIFKNWRNFVVDGLYLNT